VKAIGVRFVRIDADETPDLHASGVPGAFADCLGVAHAKPCFTPS
jgi:hypothetical protein